MALADLYAKVQQQQQQPQLEAGGGNDLVARFVTAKRREEADLAAQNIPTGYGVWEQQEQQAAAFRVRTMAMVDKLALLSASPPPALATAWEEQHSDDCSSSSSNFVAWNEAQIMRAYLQDVVRQLTTAQTAADAQACLEKAKVWLRVVEQRALQRVAQAKVEGGREGGEEE